MGGDYEEDEYDGRQWIQWTDDPSLEQKLKAKL
jgi:hypothetical protein